jgi:Peptidase MA superfamily
MRRCSFPLSIALLLIGLALPALAGAQSRIEITDHGTQITFPDRITFSAHITSDAPIARVVLEYGVVKLTCGEVVAKAFPDFPKSKIQNPKSADVSWTWEMRQSGSEPPGTTIWYRWRVADASGAEQVSDEQRMTWLDDAHPWRSDSDGKLTLHWYGGSQTFAHDLLTSAVSSLERLGQETGVTPESPIDLYIYVNTSDMRDAILYEPGWTGGQAFPEHDIVIIGISPQQIEWGKRTEAHELTHVLVGHLTFSCLSSVPTWLNEGIAVYGEGGPEPPTQAQLQNAIDNDSLISVRALSGGFSEHPSAADLSYGESYSLVNYLVSAFGQKQIVALFGELRGGQTIEDALEHVYGFGLDGLEDRWRESVGARPRRAAGAAPTATVPPTLVPTYRPISGAPLAPTAGAAPTLVALPTNAPAGAAVPPAAVPPAESAAPSRFLLIVGVALVGGALVVIVAGVAIVKLVMRKRRSAG